MASCCWPQSESKDACLIKLEFFLTTQTQNAYGTLGHAGKCYFHHFLPNVQLAPLVNDEFQGGAWFLAFSA